MLDFVKRVCIALALATFIGVLFLGTMTTLAAENEDDGYFPNELIESLIWPTVGDITDTYGTRGGKHFGIDLAAPEGTPVVAIADGVVSRSYYSNSYGHVIFIEHEHGFEAVYAHLKNREVQEGQAIEEGELIGTVGSTGRSSGNHLHFEVHQGNWNPKKSESIDPLLVLSQEPEAMYASAEIGKVKKQEKAAVSVMSDKTSEHEDKDEQAKVEQKDGEQKIEVLIKRGDTLSELAVNFDVTVDKLMEWNGLESDLIIAGEMLIVYHV